jgi:hypothetical protein
MKLSDSVSDGKNVNVVVQVNRGIAPVSPIRATYLDNIDCTFYSDSHHPIWHRQL